MTAKQKQQTDRIVKDPEILCGKPTVRGTRIPVDLVLEHLAYNLDLVDLFAAYPRLTVEDVKACLAYAARAVRVRARSDTATKHRPAPPQQAV